MQIKVFLMREKAQMAEKHFKKCWTFLVASEIWIKVAKVKN